MYCTNCGEHTEPENSLCTHCGFDLTAIIALLNEPDEDLDDVEDEVRSAEQIAKRALALAAVVSCAYGDSKEDVSRWLKNEKLWDDLSPSEKTFLETETSTETNAELTWKIEALIPLLWAINKIDEMPGIDKQCDTDPLKQAVIWSPDATHEYISSSELRDEDEIFDEYEKVYQAHWEVRDAQLNNKTMPKKYDPEVVYERHYGFNWLTGYMGQGWDDITTDT